MINTYSFLLFDYSQDENNCVEKEYREVVHSGIMQSPSFLAVCMRVLAMPESKKIKRVKIQVTKGHQKFVKIY